ncbi:unnamed protein product, partial [Effrenium voratum]
HLRSAIRANTGAKAGRYYFEVQVLETVPNAPICLLVGFSTDRSSLFLDSAESIAFDAEGRRWDPSKPKAKLAERVGLLLDRQEDIVSVFVDGELVKDETIQQSKALFPTLVFQNLTLAVRLLPASLAAPSPCMMFGNIGEEHRVASSLSALQSSCREVVVPVALPGCGLYDWSHRLLEEKSEHGLRRAYRTMAKEFHPDKGGSEALTADLTSLRDSLVREPLKFQIFRAMFEGQLQPFSSLESTRVEVQLREGWPYLQVELDFDHGGLLLDGGSWTFAFGLKNGSTVHYRGDERSGGYDVCCDFVRDSQCQRHSLSRYNASTCQAEGECDSPYAASDCPLPARVMARVRRPLHQNVTGQWGGALQVKASSGEEVACVAFAFAHQDKDTGAANGSEPSAPEPLEDPAPDTEQVEDVGGFRHLSSGSFCEDGGDLLEGALDNYGGMSPFGGAARASAESSLFYGSKCRQRCQQRPRCRFYTAYSSGWCQLSSRCSMLAKTGDPLTVTFAKSAKAETEARPEFLEIGEMMMESWCVSSGLSRARNPGSTHSRDEPDLCFNLEELSNKEAWRKRVFDLAKLSGRCLVHSSVRKGLLEAERRSFLENFPGAKKIAVVLFGRPDDDFRDWAKQQMRRQHQAARAELDRRIAQAEAAGEQPPEDELPEPSDEAIFLPSATADVAEKLLARDFGSFSLPSKAEGFDEIRYEWADEEGAQKELRQWLQEKKANHVVEGLTPGKWFHERHEAWKELRKIFQKGQMEFSEKIRSNAELAEKATQFARSHSRPQMSRRR